MSVKIKAVAKELPKYSRTTKEILPFLDAWLFEQDERFKRKVTKIFEGALVDRRYSIMDPAEVFTNTSFEQRNDIYIRKAYQVYVASMLSPNCPLHEYDIKKIKRRLRWKHSRDILSVAFKKGKLIMAIQIFFEADFGIVQLMQGMKPYTAVKNKFQKKI